MLTLTALIILAPAVQPLLAPPQQVEGPDILPLALITMGAILGAAAIGTLLYLFRQRVGFWLHRPPAANPDEHEQGHP